MTARYAIYFSPPDGSQLAEFAEAALKRRPDGAQVLRGPLFGSLEAHRAQAAFPRHYGFHATLKAPFELADRHSLSALCEAVDAFCSDQPPLLLEGLAPQRIAGFLGLACAPSQALQAFAFDIVTTFEPWRAPLSAPDIARRKPDRLTARQRAHLQRFGYPHVGEDFRFHMTLSGDQDAAFLAWLSEQYEAMVTQPVWLDQLAIFSQPNRSAPFVRQSIHPLRSDAQLAPKAVFLKSTK